MIGSALAHYEVTEHLGTGGMGEVYRARDGKLGRDVAIKLLPDAFAGDAERLARFEREARLLASLSHPSVAAIYGLEESRGRRFLVLELAPGETLAERIARGAVPVEEAIEISLQIADALEAAHEKGIVHRDLKPANVKLSGDGRVKVLDFGLAKALAGDDSGESDPASLATLTRDATRAGVILGTPAYMSPEQARGKPVDRRADLWAFGVVLHEMLTGRALFRGETVNDTVAEVLKTDFDWGGLPEDLPPSLRRLLRRCLERDPRRRMRDAGDVRLELEAARAGEPEPAALAASAAAARRRPRWRGLALHGAILGLFLVAASQLVPEWARRGAARGLPLRRFAIPAAQLGRFSPSISPDATRIAFASDGLLFVRDLDRLEARELGGENVTAAFWSWDGAWLAYGAGPRLYKVPADGTDTPVAIADLAGAGFTGDAGGGAWLRDDTILFTTGGGGLYRVPARGGDPELELAPAEGEIDFHAVRALPDGSGALLIVHRQEGPNALIAYRAGERHPVLELPGQQIFHAAYSATGHLVYDRAQGGQVAIWAAPFSLGELLTTGEPFLVARGAGRPDIAPDGTLVFVPHAGRAQRELVWLTADGDERELLPPLTGLRDPSLSPDGERVAYSAESDGQQDVWIADLRTGARTRVSFDGARNFAPVWFPGGERIAYECAGGICIAPADGSGRGRRLLDGFQPDVAADGGRIAFAAWGRGTRSDIWIVDLATPEDPRPLPSTPANEMEPRVSPDGRYVAYSSDETGRAEIYVRELSDEERRWQVSHGGGMHPRWSPAGDALCYASGRGNELWRVSVSAGSTLRLGAPERLFDWRGGVTGWYDIAPRDRGYVALRWIRQDADGAGLVVVQGWYGEFAEQGSRRAE